MRHLPALMALLLPVALSGCGEDPTADTLGTCAVAEIAPATGPLYGHYFGQEIWISWHSKDPQAEGFRFPRRKEDALQLAQALCAKVHAGEDIGKLARQHSNGDWAVAQGFTVVPHPSHRNQPDARDLALFRTPVGEITPLIEWRGGYWFARRIDPDKGQLLAHELERLRRLRARARVIHIHHRDAYPYRHAFKNFTEDDAIKKAWALIEQIQHVAKLDPLGALPKFIELAKAHSNEEGTRARGGSLETEHPITGETTEWVRLGDRAFPGSLLDVIFDDDKAVPGHLWPEPIRTGRGVQVLWLEERTDAPDKSLPMKPSSTAGAGEPTKGG